MFPLLAVTASAGCGLLVRRLAGDSLPPVLVLPCGFAGMIVVGTAGTSISALAPATGWLIAAVAVAGFISARPLLRVPWPASENWRWAAAAAAGAFAAFAAPVILTGAPTFTGYLRIVDLAHQFDFTQQLIHDGRSLQEPIDSSFEQVVAKLVDSGYPGGFHSVLGGLARLVDTDIAWVYQPLVAVAAAMGALALYGLMDGLVDRPPLRALAAFIAAQPNLLYGYGLAGGFKELITAGLLVLVVALLRANRFDVPTWRSALPIAVVAAAGFAVISYTFLPWLGLILGCAFLLAASRRPAWPLFAARWAWLVVLTALLCLPTLDAARKASGLTGVVEGQGDLGNLAAPLKPWTSAGVWLTGDYRYPLTQRVDLTYVLVGFVLVLAAIGVVYAVRRRQAVPIVLALAFGGALAYVTQRTGPWVDAKAFAITGMVCVALAFVGAAALRRGPLRLLAWPAAAVVAAAVLFGNALAYQQITLAPRDQLRDLERLGTQLPGRGPTLYPAFNEYAEYFLRRQRATSLVNPANFRLEVRPEIAAGRSGIQFAWDLDDFVPSFVQSFEYIVERGNPVAGRPPSNYVLVEGTQYHRVWRKDLRRPRVLRHFPFYGRPGERGPRNCRRIADVARGAAPGARVAYKLNPTVAVFEPASAPVRPRGWGAGYAVGSLMPQGPGTMSGPMRVPQNGRYRVWLGGSFGRPVDVSLDERSVGSIAYQENYPGQFEYLGERDVTRGRHSVEIVRGKGSLHPGSGNGVPQSIGPLILERVSAERDRVHYAPAERAMSLCRGSASLDWLEVVGPAQLG